ncbi:MAG: protein kinase domain-containing protein, partial [Ktedonobacteraceae bacterium]
MARCLNPRPGGSHEVPANAICCPRCDFLVQGAHIAVYEVVSFIGAGSYGHVYKVREPAPLSRILALKVLRFDQLNEKALGSFFDEARRIADLQHLNILPVYYFGKLEDERPYFVMEYAPQTIYDLFRRADGSRRVAFADELVPYIQQAAEALNYVHKNGLIHQDVKPGNLLIGRNSQLLLSDFGTTFYLGMQTHASLGEATGTAAYMPPEQWQGNPRRDSDQYALAVSCYELLAGRTPFTYKRLEEMWNAHFREEPVSPRHWNHRIPAEVAAVILRGMSKDYRQRYPNVLEFAEKYANAVQIAQQRYLCHHCGHQNRTGASRCSECGSEQDDRHCIYCDTPVRFGQRCCAVCGRLTLPPSINAHSPLAGVSVRQGRYTIKRVLKSSEEYPVTVAVASDMQRMDTQVVLKRWECTNLPVAQRARDIAHYEWATEQITRLRHPLIPRVLDRFAEGKYYYLVLAYIDGESLEERLQRLLRPLPEREVLGYMHTLLNILMVLEQQKPALRHFDITPSNILLEKARGRVMLTGFQIPPPPASQSANGMSRPRTHTTRKLVVSPYLPVQDKPYDQRT